RVAGLVGDQVVKDDRELLVIDGVGRGQVDRPGRAGHAQPTDVFAGCGPPFGDVRGAAVAGAGPERVRWLSPRDELGDVDALLREVFLIQDGDRNDVVHFLE